MFFSTADGFRPLSMQDPPLDAEAMSEMIKAYANFHRRFLNAEKPPPGIMTQDEFIDARQRRWDHATKEETAVGEIDMRFQFQFSFNFVVFPSVLVKNSTPISIQYIESSTNHSNSIEI